MEHKLQKLHSLKKIKLTENEETILRGKLARYIQETPIEHVSVFQAFVSHGLRVVLSSSLFLILIGGSISALANSSLPGDPLYSFKLNVNEEVKGKLTKQTPEQKVAFQQERIETRLKEIKLLADTQTFTKEKRAVVTDALSEHTTQLSAELGTLSAERPEEALKVTAELEETLRMQKNTLEAVIPESRSEQQAAVLQVVDTAIASVVQEEQRIIDAELSKLETEVLNTESIEGVSEALDPHEATPQSDPANNLPVTPLEP